MPTRYAPFLAEILLALSLPCAEAGEFFSDFNHGLSPHAQLKGDASIESFGGAKNSGMLQLTESEHSWMGTFILDPLDGDKPTSSFTATFKAFLGNGTGADGMGFHFGQFPDTPFGEGPVTNELTVTFDTYQNTPEEIAPGIRVYYKNKLLGAQLVPELRAEKFVDVFIKLDPDGTLNVGYNNALIITNLPTFATNIVGRFALGARVGERKDQHLIDDLKIVSQTSPRAFLDKFEPVSENTSPSPLLELELRDFGTRVSANTIQLKLDNNRVKPVISQRGGKTKVIYEPDVFLEADSIHTVNVSFLDDGTPTGTNDFTYCFKITSQVQVMK